MKTHHLDECSCCAKAYEHTTELEDQIKELLSTNEGLVDKCQRYEEALKILAYGKSLGSWEMMRELAQQALKGGGGE